MTTEVAKKTLQDMWECLFNEMTNHTFEDLKEHGMLDNYSTAFNMAISALSESDNEGEWIEDENFDVDDNGRFVVKCSKCGEYHGYSRTSFCPYCGAKMTWVGAVHEPYKKGE